MSWPGRGTTEPLERPLVHAGNRGGAHVPELELGPLVRASGYTSRSTLAIAMRWNGTTCRAFSERGLTVWAADRAACALGRHPIEIWGPATWLEALDALEELDEVAS